MSPCLRGGLGCRTGDQTERTLGELYERAGQRQGAESVLLGDGCQFGESFVRGTPAECDQDALGDIQGPTVDGWGV